MTNERNQSGKQVEEVVTKIEKKEKRKMQGVKGEENLKKKGKEGGRKRRGKKKEGGSMIFHKTSKLRKILNLLVLNVAYQQKPMTLIVGQLINNCPNNCTWHQLFSIILLFLGFYCTKGPLGVEDVR